MLLTDKNSALHIEFQFYSAQVLHSWLWRPFQSTSLISSVLWSWIKRCLSTDSRRQTFISFDNDCHSLWFIETQLLFVLSCSLNIIQEEMKSAVSELKGIEVCQDDFSFYGPHTILFDQRLTTVLRHLLKIKYA